MVLEFGILFIGSLTNTTAVEEFNSQLKGLDAFKARFKNTFTKVFGKEEPEAIIEPVEEPPNPNDPHPLPRIPAGWKPDNISAEKKRLRLIELAKQTPGFPDPNIKEYYHTQEEIEVLRVQDEYQRSQDEIIANNAEVERVFGKTRDQVTWQQWAEWQRALNISPSTGRSVNPVYPSSATQGGIPTSAGGHGQAHGPTAPVVPGQRTARRRPIDPIYPPASTGDTPVSAQTPSTGQPTSASSSIFSRPSMILLSEDGEELTSEQIEQYFADFEEDDGDTAGSTIPADQSSPYIPTAGDISGAGRAAQEAMDVIANQFIEEAEIKAQMLQEEAERAVMSGATNAVSLQEEAHQALKNVERIRDEQRRNVPRRIEGVPRQGFPMYPSEDDDGAEDEDMDDGEDLYGD